MDSNSQEAAKGLQGSRSVELAGGGGCNLQYRTGMEEERGRTCQKREKDNQTSIRKEENTAGNKCKKIKLEDIILI